MNSLAYFHEVPADEQTADWWLTCRGNLLPALLRPHGRLTRHPNRTDAGAVRWRKVTDPGTPDTIHIYRAGNQPNDPWCVTTIDGHRITTTRHVHRDSAEAYAAQLAGAKP